MIVEKPTLLSGLKALLLCIFEHSKNENLWKFKEG